MYEVIGLNGLGVRTNYAKGFKTLESALILSRVMMYDHETLAIEVYDDEGKIVLSIEWDDFIQQWLPREIVSGLDPECKSPEYIRLPSDFFG